MSSIRSLARGGGLVLAILAFSGLAAAQSPNGGAELGPGTRIGIRFVVGLVVNLLLGGLLVALGPRYAREAVDAIRDDPGGAFGWGLLVGIGGPIVLALLAATVVGLVVAIPGFVVLVVVGLVGNAVTVVWVGDSLVGSGTDVDAGAVGAGALALAIPGAIPVLGNFVTAILGFFGLGVVGRGLVAGWRD